MYTDVEIAPVTENYGAKTPESLSFHFSVYEAVCLVPFGRVTTYGHIAKIVGSPEKSRHVGFALKHLPRPSLAEPLEPSTESRLGRREIPQFNIDTVPWQRIINSQGKVSSRPTSVDQIARIRQEHVQVSDDGLVDLAEYGWFPDPEELDF